MPSSLKSRVLFLVTAIMAASAASAFGLIWYSYSGSQLAEQQERLSQTLTMAASLLRDRHEDQASNRTRLIKEQRTGLKSDLALFVGALEEQYASAQAAGKSTEAAQRDVLAAAARISERTGHDFFIFDKNLSGLFHTDQSLAGRNWRDIKGDSGIGALEFAASIADRDGWDTLLVQWPTSAAGVAARHLACITTFAQWGWYLGVSVDYEHLASRATQDRLHMVRGLLDSLSRVSLGRTGRMFVLEANGASFLLVPTGNARAVLDAHENELRVALANLESPSHFSWNDGQGGYVAQALFLPGMGWELGIIMEQDELAEPAVTLARRLGYALLLVFAAGAALAAIMTQKLTRPILDLAAKARDFNLIDGAGPETARQLRGLAQRNPGETAILASAWADTLDALDAGISGLREAAATQRATAGALAASKHELEELNLELENRVGVRTAALEAANARLRNSEARYRSLFMNSPVAFLEVNLASLLQFLASPEMASVDDVTALAKRKPDFAADLLGMVRVLDANPAAVEMAGAASKAELLANLDRIVLPQSFGLLRGSGVFRAGAPSCGYESTFRTIGGRMRHTIVGLRPLPGSEQSMDRVLISVMDITRLKEGEEDLRAAHEQAQSASKAKTDFLANMSHEIRTPISAILGLAELSQRNADPAKTAVHLRMIAESAQTLLGIIGDVLDLSRVEAGKLFLDDKPFDLAVVVNRAAGTFRAACADKGLDLAVNLAPGIPGGLTGDPVRLGQILANLVGNAVKFTASGRIDVTVTSLEDGLGDLPASPQDGDDVVLLFSVEDTGIGVLPELTGVIFDSFRQADSSFSKSYQGVGLGLAISRELAALMGGRIWVESQPGKGSAFRFTARFGIDRGALASSRRALPAAGKSAAGVRILVAEDNTVNRHVFKEFLLSQGYAVACVTDGSQALEALAREPYDLVFMDVQMPVIDGLEAVRRLRAGECGEAAAGIPVVALTAYAMSGDRERFLEAGMSGYLPKPVPLDQLQAAVAEFAGSPGDVPEPAPSPGEDVREALKPLQEEFIAYVGQRASDALGHVAAGEFDMAAKAGHDVKGTSMAFGAHRVNELGAMLEAACQDGNAALAAKLAEKILEVLAELESPGGVETDGGAAPAVTG
ncbi:response regulator [Fundidesulfovibrio terrae]|uniref:response regulator n=1 Tax=Fundidesulfovibrio terrae TaxID=2922866 RepID=UPI001FAFA715|nr:response regulator [Fundidesulfovibrio terrae]